MNKVMQRIFFTLFGVLIFLGCNDSRAPGEEADLIAHKKAAYAYNLTFVKKKQVVSKIYKTLVAAMDSLEQGKVNALAKSPSFVLDSSESEIKNSDALLARALTHTGGFFRNVLLSNPEFAHLSFIDKDGFVYNFPELDSGLMVDKGDKLNAYFTANMLDSSLTRYGSWSTVVRVEPFKGKWVYSCVRAINLGDKIQGWVVADVNLETLNSLIPQSEKEDYLIMSKDGGITFLGNDAAARCSIPKAVPHFSPGNSLNTIDPNKLYSVYNTRDAAVRTAFGKIITENSTREIISNNRLNIMLVVSPVNETSSLFIRVLEL